MFEHEQQQQQRQQQKPNFKFVIRSKIDSNATASSSEELSEKKQIESKQAVLEEQNDRKRKRTAAESLTSSKKIHTQLQRWNKKHIELKNDKEIEEQSKIHYADFTTMACLLCQRKFKSKAELERHQDVSELHKSNLNDPIAVNKATLKLNFSKTEPTEGQAEEPYKTKYRNRAAERRQAYGQPEKPVLSPPLLPYKHTNGPRDISAHIANAALEKPISEDNKGAQMLLNMGWRKGEGLGRDRSGIINPVKAESYGKNAGIGSTSKYKVDPNASYKEQTSSMARQRFNP
ncbi:hypothetical protein G6F56_010900 [Rhizopus delemar]|nr:hypothetical protein G6F56_010900 [Rhizopus delemar]